MNIILFFENIIPDSNAVSVRSNYLIKELVKHQGVDKLTILTATENANQYDSAEVITLGKNLGIRKNNFVSRIIREVKLAFWGSIEVFKIRKSIDVVYISSPPFITSVMLVFFCKLLRRKYILEIRDIYPEAYLYAGFLTNGFISRMLSSVSKKMYSGAILNVCATDGLKKLVLEQVSDARAITGLNGFPSRLIALSNCRKYRKFTLVFHGILGEFQNVDVLCGIGMALGGNDNIEFIVIGEGSKARKIEKVFSQYSNLKYLGKKSFSETMDIVKRCHMGLSLRLNDPLSLISFPVKSWEYFGLGIPSITTPIGSEADVFFKALNCEIPIISEELHDLLAAIYHIEASSLQLGSLSCQARANRVEYTRENLSEKLVSRIVQSLE